MTPLTRQGRASVLGVLGLLPALLAPRPPAVIAAPPRARAPAAPADDASCRICHPGATKGLRQSEHAFLLDKRPADSCTPCHGDLTEHARAAVDRRGRLPAVPAVTAAACAVCHTGAALSPARTAHAWRRAPERWAGTVAEPAGNVAEPAGSTPVPELATARGPLDLDWSALVTAGYRFVQRSGSRARYDTDLDLDRGFRLLELEVEGRGDGRGPIDLLRLRADGLADPDQRFEAHVDKSGVYRAEADYHRSTVKYRASGNFHRVDRKSQDATYELSVHPIDDLEVFGSFQRGSRNSFWLTNRIGNQNTTPLVTIPGVASPRRYDSDRYELGVTGRLGPVGYTAAADYLDDREIQTWSFSRPAPLNPVFPESESFSSKSSLYGPGARLLLSHADDGFSFDLSGRVLDLQRRVLGAGTQSGFDIGEFTTTTASSSGGDALTWLLDGSASLELTEGVELFGDMRWTDHHEEMRIAQAEVTTYTSPPTTTAATTNLLQRTAQRQLESSIGLDYEVVPGLILTGGYGWSREWLSVPDLEAGDNDFRSGTIRDRGLLAGVQWRPDEHWMLDVQHRDFGQSGARLDELTEDRARRTKGRLRYREGALSVETFGEYRQRNNSVSDTSLRSVSTGLSGSVAKGEQLDLYASYVFADLDGSTLTNFYFDPDPAPQATRVGFKGETHTVTAGFGSLPSQRVRWRLDGSLTDTRGSFDVRLLDLRADVSWEILPGGAAGVALHHIRYDEAGSNDDYDAFLTFLYWRQKL